MTDLLPELLSPPVGRAVDEVLLLPLREDSEDLFNAWTVAHIATNVRLLVGVRGGQVIAVAAVNGAVPVAGTSPVRVQFQRSNEPIDLRGLADLLDRDVHNLRMWGGPRRLALTSSPP